MQFAIISGKTKNNVYKNFKSDGAIGEGVIGCPYSQGAADGMQAENMESYYSVRYAMAE